MTNHAQRARHLAAVETLVTGSGQTRPSDEARAPTLASGDDPPVAAAAAPVTVQARGSYDDLAVTTIDPERYGLDREIARGGMGRIIAAHDRRLGRPVAIKELLIGTSELRARFERETRITARLQHPAIVNLLEAGTWPGGEPFYVMKLVSGESLDKVIAQRPTLEARLGLLPNVIAVVDALAYAHSLRVIHRDLKPANVLVGEFGETVVIDWGLAKDFADTSGAAEVSGAHCDARATAGQTEVGSVMGTPAYMPREQAAGETVDERADVYALGAILYHVLAGAAPYAGKTNAAILDAVIAGPPQPLAAMMPTAPLDLLTIVTKAMARDATDRYPTAKQLAADLKKFQTGQLVGAHHYSAWQLLGRWARRHRTALAVGVVAIVLLGALGVASVRRVVREQARTEQSQRDAEELMRFMLTDLRDKLAPLGKLDLLDAVANKAVAYFAMKQDHPSHTDLQSRAIALTNLGDVLSAEGHAEAALRQYRAAMAIALTEAASDPARGDLRHQVSVNHERIGDVLFAQGDIEGALPEYRAGMAIDQNDVTTNPAEAGHQRDLSISHEKVGNVLFAKGDAEGALVQYRAAIAITQALAPAGSTNAEYADYQRDLFDSHDKIGKVLVAQGNTDGALAEYRAGMKIAQTLVAAAPTNADLQRDLFVAHVNVGSMLAAQGNPEGALAELRAGLAITQALAAADTTNANRQRDLADSHEHLGDVVFAQGDTTGALVEFQAALAIDQALVDRDPTNAQRRQDLAVSQERVGDALSAQGDAAGALVKFRASMAIRASLAAADPTNADNQREVSVGHEKLGDALIAQGDVAGALVEYRTELDIDRSLAALDPTNAERQRDLSVSQERVGNVLVAHGDMAGALAEYRAGMAIRVRLLTADPTNIGLQRDVSISQEKLGNVFLAQGDVAGALAEYRAALSIRAKLRSAAGTNTSAAQDLSEIHELLGNALLANHDRRQALEEYDAGLAIARQLAAEDPMSASVRDLVARLAKKRLTCCSAKTAKHSR